MKKYFKLLANLFPGFLLCLMVFTSGCAASKKTANKALKTRTSGFLLDQMIKRQVNADWFEGRAKLNYTGEYLSMGVTATVRMRKDSVLWVSIRKLGFEAVRALVTRDSVYVIDRLNNQYGVESINWLGEQFSIPADLHTLQMIFLGNPVFFNPNELQLETAETHYRLFNQNDNIKSIYQLNGKNLLLEQMSFNDQRYNRSFDYELMEYQLTADKQNFSYFRNLQVDSRETGKANIEIKFSEVEFNVPKNIRFEIPKRYKKIDLE